MQHSRRSLGCEPCAGNCQLEGSGSDIGKGELSILTCYHLLGRGVIFTGKAYTGSSDDGSRTINNRSADTPWQLLIGRLLVGRVPHPLIFGTRHWSLLNGLAKADRRATQSGKRENYESRIKTESHEYFLSFAQLLSRSPKRFKGIPFPPPAKKQSAAYRIQERQPVKQTRNEAGRLPLCPQTP